MTRVESDEAGHPGPARRALLEWGLLRPRLLLVGVLLVALALSWTWIVLMARDMYGPMTGPSAWMMTSRWDGPHLLLLWAMWVVMMAAMMLPSAAPLLLLYARAVRGRRGGPQAARATYALAAGYVVVWAVFSLGATFLQRRLAGWLLLSPMMEPATPAAAAGILLLAGAYQLTPLKRACLRACRSPLSFLSRHWRPGTAGGLHMGIRHGLDCLGCCWALMLLLFAGGVMNLAVIGALTAWVLVEKLAPFGEQSARVSGLLLLATGVWVLVR